ncbi:DUF5753 domain-containing protein [Nocardia aurantiaca]|uniref:DUF5753 domain-containing protein n=1 Tax=Nocardia aurantiaca TaxID=2675850 RepID=UPI002286DDDF|nr:DUF5753 domain-containing protein [Nocardia aurantiaca]
MYSSAFKRYVGLEAAARRLTIYHDQRIPGLLQTADYARAIISASPKFTSSEDIEKGVEHRLKRQALITHKTNAVELDVMLHVSVLYWTLGGPNVMAGALRHLAEMSKYPNITIRVRPYSAGLTWGLPHGSFILLGSD